MDIDHLSRRSNGSWYIRLVHHGSEADAHRDTLVRWSQKEKYTQKANSSSQALHLYHRRLLPNPPLPPPDPHPRFAAPPHPRHNITWQFHPLRAVADRTHRNGNPTLRLRKREWKLPGICVESSVQRGERGDVSVAHAEQYLSVLEGRVCV
jgi:hypothetical protein